MIKTKRKALIVSAITILAFLAPPFGQVGKVTAQQKTNLPTVQTGVICDKVENRDPTGIGDSYPSSIGTLYCFTKLTDIPSEGTIYHIWYHGNKEMAKVELSISPPQWRTYSSKIILPSWKGDWKVEIVSGNHILKTLAFTIE